VEPSLGIVAASACVLRPLFKKFYGLSSNGGSRTHQSQRATGGSTWNRVRTGGRSQVGEESVELGKRPIENRSVITSGAPERSMTSMSNQVGAQTRDKKGMIFTAKSLGGSNSSQEELTAAREGGIQVQRTVNVVRSPRVGDIDYESRSSTDVNPHALRYWPKE
jgi:hypothetical protein